MSRKFPHIQKSSNPNTASLKLTPLRVANVPPPMALHELELEFVAIDAALSMSGTRLAVLSDTDVAIYALDMRKRPVPPPTLLWRTTFSQDCCPRQVAFIQDDQFFVLTDDWDMDESSIWASEDKELVYCGHLTGLGRVSSIVPNVDFRRLFAQSQDGSLHEVETTPGLHHSGLQHNMVNKFPSFVPEVRVVSVGDKV